MADPSVPPVLADYIAQLERRVRALENGQALRSSSIRGGTLRVLDDDGSPVVAIGKRDDDTVSTEIFDAAGDIVARFGQLDAGVRTGVEVYNGAGTRVLRADERGALEPNVAIPFTVLQDVSVNSGTFTTTHRSRLPVMKNPYLHLEVDIDCDVGSTGELRLTIIRTPGGTQTSAVKSVPSGALQTYHLYIQINMALDGRALFLFETRRASGGGAIRAGIPFADLGDYSATATTSGVWV